MTSWTNTDLVELIARKNKELLKEISELKEMVRELKLEIIFKLDKKDLDN